MMGVDHSSVEGVSDTPYQIPGQFTGLTDIKKPTTLLWWRSVGHSHTAFVMESMMDEAAKAADRDPVEFRLAHLGGSEPRPGSHGRGPQTGRGKERLGQSSQRPEPGHRRAQVFRLFVAEVVEISGDAVSGVQIEKVTCAVDCGVAVNPDIVKAQMEGGIGYGIGQCHANKITLTEGMGGPVELPRLRATENWRYRSDRGTHRRLGEAPSGVGEPGTPPAAPALANAIAASGHRVTEMPMIDHGVTFA